MSWAFPKFDNRVQIGTPTQDANDDGGLDFNFSVALTTFMSCNPIGDKGVGSKYVRGKQVSETATHEFICRLMSVARLGKEFALSFSGAFRYFAGLMPLSSNYFLFMQRGSSVKGRLFRIHEVMNVGEKDELLSIIAEEIEERGTGAQV